MKKPLLLLAIATITFSTGVLAHTLPATNITNQCACTADMSNGTYVCEKTTEHATDVVFASGVSSDNWDSCTFNKNDAFGPGATAEVSDVNCENKPVFEVTFPNSDLGAYSTYQQLGSPVSLLVIQIKVNGVYVPSSFNPTWIDTNTCAYTGPTI